MMAEKKTSDTQLFTADSTESRAESQPDACIDITGEVCPMTFVRTRLALDRLAPGQTLLVALRGSEPLRNVPLSAAEQGHAVLSLATTPDGVSHLLLRRAG
jgi:tRNA 2-thiouridine synthesizing protein A